MKPKGTNNLNSKYSYVQRELYEKEVTKLQESKSNLSFIDLRKKNLYGKIDLQNNIVVPRLESQVFHEGLVAVYPFVSQALTDLSAKIDSRISKGTMRQSGPYSQLILSSHTQTWREEYSEYLKSLTDSYRESILADSAKKSQISDFRQYAADFMNFASVANPRFPLTFSKFYLSTHSSPFLSGISVDMNSEQYGNDFVSFDVYFEDVNFNTFYREAQNHGFIIDRHAPWRLVANLTSKPMREYMQKGGYANVQDVFSTLAFRPMLPEFFEFVKTVNFSYSEVFKPGSTVAEICYKNGKTSYSLKPREYFDPTEFKSLEEMIAYMGYPFWLRAYSFVKAREINKNLTQKEFDDIVREAISIQKHIDTEASLMYINDKFNPLMDSDFDKKPTFTF